jgi:hypothetical protein
LGVRLFHPPIFKSDKMKVCDGQSKWIAMQWFQENILDFFKRHMIDYFNFVFVNK